MPILSLVIMQGCLSEQNGDGEDDVVEAFSTGFSLENGFEGLTFNDIIVTGNGNDVVMEVMVLIVF